MERHERDAIRDADAQLSDLQETLQNSAQQDALNQESVGCLFVTARDVIARINRGLSFHIDADAPDEVRQRLVKLLALPTEDRESLDIAAAALVEAEAVRHILRDALQGRPLADPGHAGEVVRLLEAWLPGLHVRQLAELLGSSERALQRRRADGGESTARQQIVAPPG